MSTDKLKVVCGVCGTNNFTLHSDFEPFGSGRGVIHSMHADNTVFVKMECTLCKNISQVWVDFGQSNFNPEGLSNLEYI